MSVAFNTVGALAANTTTTTLNVVAPTFDDTDPKNILIAHIAEKGSQAVTPPSGFSQIIDVNGNGARVFVFWKRAASGDSGATKAFTKPVDDNALFTGVIGVFSGCLASATPIDATAATGNNSGSATDTVSYSDFNPTETDAFVVALGYYNDNQTTAGAISGTNPSFTKNWDLETATGDDASHFGYSGSSDGAATGARSHSTTSTVDAIAVGILFGLVAEPPPAGLPPNSLAMMGIGT